MVQKQGSDSTNRPRTGESWERGKEKEEEEEQEEEGQEGGRTRGWRTGTGIRVRFRG